MSAVALCMIGNSIQRMVKRILILTEHNKIRYFLIHGFGFPILRLFLTIVPPMITAIVLLAFAAQAFAQGVCKFIFIQES
jgi:hypothetical protein